MTCIKLPLYFCFPTDASQWYSPLSFLWTDEKTKTNIFPFSHRLSCLCSLGKTWLSWFTCLYHVIAGFSWQYSTGHSTVIESPGFLWYLVPCLTRITVVQLSVLLSARESQSVKFSWSFSSQLLWFSVLVCMNELAIYLSPGMFPLTQFHLQRG